MTRSVRTLFAAVFTICLIIEITSALPFTKSRSRRSSDGYGDVMDSNMSQQDLLLLQKLLSPPSKRQLCRSGYSYNPVYGGCRASLGLLRGRSRGQF